MSGPEDADTPVDEFDWIATGLRPLTLGAPEALYLLDDAAVIASRPGFDLIVSKDAIVAGVHFLPDDPPGLVARKLLRVNLSDLAAKGAEPDGYFLAVAWPPAFGWAERKAFAAGLAHDQAEFGLRLFGGDTVATPGPLTASVTILGWTPAGRMVRRGGARPGDRLLVTGTIGDGWLGLRAAEGEDLGLSPDEIAWLADRYRLPQPRGGLRAALLDGADAAADVSDGLIADAGNIARASGVGLHVDLAHLPLSDAAQAWLDRQPDAAAARLALAGGGDDYEIVLAAPAGTISRLAEAAAAIGLRLTDIGEVKDGGGVEVRCGAQVLDVQRAGYRHDGSSH
jgi:thiamine-monophosphate kinase